MFNNWEVCEQESIHFASNWKSQKDVTNNEAQTSQYQLESKQVQYPSIDNKANQTLDFTKDRSIKSPKIQYNSDQVNLFLKNNIELIENEILKSVSCWKKSASWLQYWNNLEGNFKLLQKFNSTYLEQVLDAQKQRNKCFISSITWNCSQTHLLVGYCVQDHQDWCTHDSYIFVWNLYQRNQINTKPEKVLEIESCISFIKAHPYFPSIYSVGTFSGKVIIINTKFTESDRAEENYIKAVSSTNFYFHQETISGLEWKIFNKKENNLGNLISFGLDGKIILWSCNEREKVLEVIQVYIIYIRDLPKTLGIQAALSDIELAIVSFSFDPENETSFIVGCQGGAIFQCCIEYPNQFKSQNLEHNFNEIKIEPKSPIVLAYAPHRTHLKWVQFSPKLRKTFVSSAEDNEIRIYNSLQPKPFSIFHCDVNFTSLQWLIKTNGIIGVQKDGYISVFSVTGEDFKIKQIQSFWLENQKRSEKVLVNYFEKEDQVAIIAEPNEVHLLSLKYF